MGENILHHILKAESPEIMQIIAVLGPFLTDFFNILVKFFFKVYGSPTVL